MSAVAGDDGGTAGVLAGARDVARAIMRYAAMRDLQEFEAATHWRVMGGT
jgi:hypothetical protein